MQGCDWVTVRGFRVSAAAATLVCVLGCSGGSSTEDADATKPAATPPPAPAAPASPAAVPAQADTDTFGWKMRQLGLEAKAKVEQCKKSAFDRMSPGSAQKALPIVKANEIADSCRWLATRYQPLVSEWLGKHYTSDGLLEKLARFQDLQVMLQAELAASRPGPKLARVINESQRMLEQLDRNAGALAEFKIDTKTADIFEPKVVPGGKIRADVEMVARNDRSDVGTLLQKWESFAVEPAKEGLPPYRLTLEHFGRVRTKWLEHHRKRLESQSSDDKQFDAKLKAVAQGYYQQSEALVAAYKAAAAPFLAAEPVDQAVVKKLRAELTRAQEAWEAANNQVTKELAEVF
jgi:hypothetical protein